MTSTAHTIIIIQEVFQLAQGYSAGNLLSFCRKKHCCLVYLPIVVNLTIQKPRREPSFAISHFHPSSCQTARHNPTECQVGTTLGERAHKSHSFAQSTCEQEGIGASGPVNFSHL